MKQIKIWLQKCTALLAMALGYAPVWVFLSAVMCADFALRSLLLGLLVLPLGAVTMALRGRVRAVWAVLSAPLYVVLALLVLPRGVGIGAYSLLAPGCALLLLAPAAAAKPLGQEWPVGLWAGGLIASVLIVLVLGARGLMERGNVMQARQVLSYLMAGYLFLLLMNLNRLSVETGTAGRDAAGVSGHMYRRNRIGVVLVFALGAVCALWNKLGQLLDSAWQGVKALLAWFFTHIRLPGRTGAPPTEDGGMAMEMGGAAEIVEKSAFALFMEKALMIIGCIIGMAAILAALYFLGKKLLLLVRRILARMKRYMQRAAEDYVDETESIFDPEEVKKLLKERVQAMIAPRKRQSAPRWQDLDARGRVRWIYREFMRRHPGSEALTAREALSREDTISRSVTEPFAALYDQARYSEHEVDGREAEKYRNLFKY